jgi:hypothetical protein
LAGAADDREPGEHSGAAEKAVLRVDNHIVVTGSRDPLGRDGMVLGHLMTDRAPAHASWRRMPVSGDRARFSPPIRAVRTRTSRTAVPRTPAPLPGDWDER